MNYSINETVLFLGSQKSRRIFMMIEISIHGRGGQGAVRSAQILAEAAFKGYFPGDPETFYNAGIYGSYAQYGTALVTAADNALGLPSPDWTSDSLAADFITNDDYAWDVSNGMELIATQRWVATFDQGLQSWFEWRRTGYPALTVLPGNNGGLVPVRVPYPTDEAARNPTSLAAGVLLLGGADNLNTRVWWDVTP